MMPPGRWGGGRTGCATLDDPDALRDLQSLAAGLVLISEVEVHWHIGARLLG